MIDNIINVDTDSEIQDVTISKNQSEEVVSSDSDLSEDENIIIHVSGATISSQVPRRRTPFEKGSNPYSRSDTPKEMSDLIVDSTPKKSVFDELKPLQFGYFRTAFDVNIEELDEHPWRQPYTDISDYFNYGFNEATWILYCEKQLRLRMAEGAGPTANNNAVEATNLDSTTTQAATTATSSIATTLPSPMQVPAMVPTSAYPVTATVTPPPPPPPFPPPPPTYPPPNSSQFGHLPTPPPAPPPLAYERSYSNGTPGGGGAIDEFSQRLIPGGGSNSEHNVPSSYRTGSNNTAPSNNQHQQQRSGNQQQQHSSFRQDRKSNYYSFQQDGVDDNSYNNEYNKRMRRE